MHTLLAIITAISAAVSLGFAIQAYTQSRNTNGPASTNAKYAFSRSLALALAACGLVIIHDSGYLIALAVVMSGVQLFDGIIGLKISRFKTFGPLLTAIANLIVLILFLTI
ncbi:hypothetical protein [Lacticaseibacillus jixiensis]|uniref:hypothetical protein n=1 Tax=Lacticaseibacillus jixiensis TaxID=3231926 RepID=UPI0036F38EDF